MIAYSVLTDINLKALSVRLVENEKGAVNWSLSSFDDSSPKSPSRPQPQSEKSEPELESDSLVLEKLILEDISVDYRRPGMIEPFPFKIQECNGAMLPGEPITLSMKGMLLKEPYTTKAVIGSLRELLEGNRSWMEIKTEKMFVRSPLSPLTGQRSLLRDVSSSMAKR